MNTFAESGEFYDPHFFDAGVGDKESGDATIQQFLRLVGDPPKRILDIGAGTGRISIPLLARGHHVTCVDKSPQMLARLASKLDSKIASRAQLLTGEFTELSPAGSDQEVAIAVDDVLLEFLSLDALSGFWGKLACWLAPGGIFLTSFRSRKFEAFNSKAAAPFETKAFPIAGPVDTVDGAKWIATTSWEEFCLNTRVLKTVCRYDVLDSTGHVHSAQYRVLMQRLHSTRELISLAGQFGLSCVWNSCEAHLDPENDKSIGGIYKFQLDAR